MIPRPPLDVNNIATMRADHCALVGLPVFALWLLIPQLENITHDCNVSSERAGDCDRAESFLTCGGREEEIVARF